MRWMETSHRLKHRTRGLAIPPMLSRRLFTASLVACLPALAAARAGAVPEGFVLPDDLAVTPRRAGAGLASALAGAWRGGSPLLPELMLVFERFPSPGEVVTVLATRARGERPGRWKRVTARLADGQVNLDVENELQASFHIDAAGRLIGSARAHGIRLPLSFERVTLP
jgi:hypothetical protein